MTSISIIIFKYREIQVMSRKVFPGRDLGPKQTASCDVATFSLNIRDFTLVCSTARRSHLNPKQMVSDVVDTIIKLFVFRFIHCVVVYLLI
jgi:hypothetical protein